MNNKNVPMETKALEIPDLALVELENKLTNLEHIVSTLEERLKTVSRPYNDNEPEATVAGTPLYSTTLGIRIDRSVTSVSNAIDRLRTILDYLEV